MRNQAGLRNPLGRTKHCETVRRVAQGRLEGPNPEADQTALHPVDQARALTDEPFALTVGALGILLRQRRNGRHVAVVGFAAQPAEEDTFEQSRVEAICFRPAMLAREDHFRPWGPAQGQSGFAWSWLGAALQATSLPFGVISAPGYRYHPAILAQAAATLCEMFPDRLWLALGSGQRLNEDLTGVAWPEKTERNARLRECADIIRALLRGETVSHDGRVTLVDCKLYTLPKTPLLLLGAAVTEATAEFVGGWADGLLTVSGKPEQVRRVVEAFRRGGGECKPLFMQVGLNWACTEAEARPGCARAVALQRAGRGGELGAALAR